jgi:CubicO group peptidase (beta-lactamase class C family)
MIQSATKVVCAAAALTLVDRGVLDYDALVASYWPELAASTPAKARLAVVDVLGHRAGLTCAGGDVPFAVFAPSGNLRFN